jgi:calcium-dependent protein kinase
MRNIFKSEVKQRYELKEVLGNGNFAEVRLGINKETQDRVAVKIIEPKDKIDEKMIKTEIEILQDIDHPNAIRLFEVFEQHANLLKGRKTCLVMELVTGGEMLERIYQKKKFPENQGRQIMKSVLDVLHYLHNKGIVHRDLKPGNILFVDDRDDSAIKVVDFGCAARLPDMSSPNTGLQEV